ncbi:aminoglycoside phosphotransferase family protein [Paenibacillus puldeungensis]|uniref:Aminoglycoside phosphotransferase family protein n=1 Tax=Paenibacillus puldeungensis TaxID=696536 RepID=A0ABW3RZQ5_9BACL
MFDKRKRSSLTSIYIHRKGERILSLLEKNTISQEVPCENRIYSYFSNKDISMPKIYCNDYDAASQEGVLLMENLTPTHESLANWEAPIEPNKRSALVETITQFHAVSWETGELPAPRHLETTAEYFQHLSYLERDYMSFRARQDFNLQPEQFDIYEKSLLDLSKNAERHIQRIAKRQHTTVIHGDLNACNILYPLDSLSKPRLIDFEAVRIGLCTEDLVTLFIHDFFHGGTETLSLFEQYYRSLCSKISSEYTYDQFQEDVRMSVMEGLFFPLKLFVHQGVEDEELIWKSIHAYKMIAQ